jgi:hypothetical protein
VVKRGPASVRTRVLSTLAIASIGAAIGYYYAREKLPPELFHGNSSLPGLYVTAGAALLVLVVRVATILRVVIREYFKRE